MPHSLRAMRAQNCLGATELREIVPDTTINLSDDTENDREIVKVAESKKDTTKNGTKKETPDNSTENKSTVNEEHQEPNLTKAPAKMIECVKDKELRKKKNACEESKENVDKDNCPVQTNVEKPESAKKRKKRNHDKKVANRADNYIEAAVNNEENTFASEEQVIGERPISWDNKNLKGLIKLSCLRRELHLFFICLKIIDLFRQVSILSFIHYPVFGVKSPELLLKTIRNYRTQLFA